MTRLQNGYNKEVREPVIVMGMHKCGTTLLAAMVHHGGTPMFAGEADPSYDTGSKYERPLCQEINRVLLGYARDDGNPHSLEAIWKRPVRPFPGEYRARLEAETLDQLVGLQPWGFKDPRTTITYPAWAEAFPTGARFYVYRSHREFLLRSLHTRQGRSWRARRMRRALEAWLQYNEAIARNCQLDAAAQRPFVVVSYARLMEDASLLSRMTQATGVALSDARDPRLHHVRETTSPREKCFLWWVEAGRRARLRQVYADLEARCLPVAPAGLQP